MTDLLIDFETYSETSLKDCGATKYASDPNFKVLCLAYKEFDPKTLKGGETKLWTFQSPEYLDLHGYDHIWALNVGFDLRAYLAHQLASEPVRVIDMPDSINSWKDIQVPLAKYSLPQSLELAAEVLNTPIKKNPRANLIIKACCKKNTMAPTQANYQELFDYCISDVDASFEVLKAIPSIEIEDHEWALWRETYRMNSRGLPIQYDVVEKVKERCDAYKQVICDSLPAVTDGLITKPTQTQRIKKYLNSKGVMVENTTADTLEKLIDRDDIEPFLSADCRMLIEARQAGGSSSVAKFNKLLDMRVGDKVHDFLRYAGTNTMRWTGAGYQVHSLPKKTVDDPEALIQDFLTFGEIENPIQSAKALCRSVIKAPPGQMLYQADYSSIEYLLLIWITDMHDMLQMFKEGKSAYIDMAAFLFDKQYDEIDKHSNTDLEYFLGKQAILGCGYQMGAKKFKATCESYNAVISMVEAEKAVKGYRSKYKPIKKLWDNVLKCCIAAISSPGEKFHVNKCDFIVRSDKKNVSYLIITLPSGSRLYYHSPELFAGKYGAEVKHMGILNYKWVRRYLSPGRITENIIQKIARDLMGYSILQVAADDNFDNLLTCHDEAVAIGSDNDPANQLKYFISLVERKDEWAETIPLKAGGFFGPRYKKD